MFLVLFETFVPVLATYRTKKDCGRLHCGSLRSFRIRDKGRLYFSRRKHAPQPVRLISAIY